MFYYNSIKITIDIFSLTKVIFNVVVQYDGLPDLIISDYDLVFSLKF